MFMYKHRLLDSLAPVQRALRMRGYIYIIYCLYMYLYVYIYTICICINLDC